MDHKKQMVQVGFRLSVTGNNLLEELAKTHGLTKTAILEIAIREKCQRDGIPVPPLPGYSKSD